MLSKRHVNNHNHQHHVTQVVTTEEHTSRSRTWQIVRNAVQASTTLSVLLLSLATTLPVLLLIHVFARSK